MPCSTMDDVAAWFAGGGPLLPFMLALSLILYALIFERLLALYSGAPERDLKRGLNSIRVLTAALPLLGLLGTVQGIMQIFANLAADNAAHAAGLSEALLATQYGLVLAVPATLGDWLIRRRIKQVNDARELEAA